MAKGIIYVMTTVVPGLIKIGKTGTDNFESRMYQLERNGYYNVVGLKRKFAIEVEDYDEKEKLLDEIFAKSNVQGSELFSLDPDLVVQLLSSFEGRQVYPETMTKEEVFIAVQQKIKEVYGNTSEVLAFGITVKDLISSKRNSNIAFPRHICMYLCRELTSSPLTEIGSKLGNRHHSTILHGVEIIEKKLEDKNENEELIKTLDVLNKKINPQ